MKSIIIHDWFINQLKLSGVKLLIFALVYSFSSFNQVCFCKVETIAKFVGCSRSQTYRVVELLCSSGFIQYVEGGLKVADKFLPAEDMPLEEMIRLAKINIYE